MVNNELLFRLQQAILESGRMGLLHSLQAISRIGLAGAQQREMVVKQYRKKYATVWRKV